MTTLVTILLLAVPTSGWAGEHPLHPALEPASAAFDMDEYLLDPEEETALARSAAPAHITDDASIWLLRDSGYELAHTGGNGFHCLVIRSWAGPFRSLDPRVRAPICLNPAAADSPLQVVLLIAREVAAGTGLDDLQAKIDTADIPLPGPGALAYMMSGAQWLNERVGRFVPHLMFYQPNVSQEAIGGNQLGQGLPVVVGGNTAPYNDITMPLPPSMFITPRALDRSVLEDASRPARDREQDAGRKALDVYEWIGIRPGMEVADVFAAFGYNTHLLSLALGEHGRVHAVRGFLEPEVSRILETDVGAALLGRIDSAALANVVVHDTLADLPDASVDAIVSIRNFHDIVFFGGDQPKAIANMRRALRPGGVVGVVEVAAAEPGWNEDAHRLHEDDVIAAFAAGGFDLIGRSDMLHNPDDDRSRPGFQIGRHTMDRYLLKFRKSADS